MNAYKSDEQYVKETVNEHRFVILFLVGLYAATSAYLVTNWHVIGHLLNHVQRQTIGIGAALLAICLFNKSLWFKGKLSNFGEKQQAKLVAFREYMTAEKKMEKIKSYRKEIRIIFGVVGCAGILGFSSLIASCIPMAFNWIITIILAGVGMTVFLKSEWFYSLVERQVEGEIEYLNSPLLFPKR